jgi:uncharacterized protein DUF6640
VKMPSVGKLLISGVAAFTAVGAYLYDYNETHMFNPQWPPHAKFHDAQTISLGSLLGFLSLWALWRAPFDQGARLRVATVLAGLYYVSQATSLLFPNVALVDPEFEAKVPKLFGRPAAQPVLDVTMLSLLSAAFALETRHEPLRGR